MTRTAWPRADHRPAEQQYAGCLVGRESLRVWIRCRRVTKSTFPPRPSFEVCEPNPE